MQSGGEVELKRVNELVHGDVALDYGTVTHREGRKVWFEERVVTFGSAEEEVRVEVGGDHRGGGPAPPPAAPPLPVIPVAHPPPEARPGRAGQRSR